MIKDITVIIVTYNSSSIIAECLKPLKKAKIKTILVDNASSDNTTEVAKKAYSDIEVIHSPGNLGYGRGNNIGLNAVKTKYALILNPDVKIGEKAIEELIKAFKNDKDIVLTAPLSIDSKKGKEVRVDRNRPYMIKEDLLYVEWVWGCCLCFDVKKLKKEVGFFDERFFLFYEEDDLIVRIREKDLKIVMPINAIIEHDEGTASEQTKKMSYRRQWNMDWSRMYYREKRKGKFKAKVKAFIYVFEGLVKLCIDEDKTRAKSMINANFTYFIGLGAFLEDNLTPRV